MMVEQKINDYALLSDCHSAALVDKTGAVKWWCVPRFDAPSVFGRLLGANAGHWSITPRESFHYERRYVGDSLVLRTEFTTTQGRVALVDALALEPGARGHDIGLRSPHALVRRVEGLSGDVRLRMELCPRPEYGLYLPRLACDEVRRSALVLKGLTYRRSGVVLAAATTSLPEEIGGELNWDNRFAWLRDASLTMQAQWVGACPHESNRFFTWLPRATGELGDQPLQIMYGAEGERDLTEHTLDHLEGFGDSGPVRVGNDAWERSPARRARRGPQRRPPAERSARAAGRGDAAVPRGDRRPGRGLVAGTRRGHVGEPRQTAALRVLEGDVLGRARPRGEARGLAEPGRRQAALGPCGGRRTSGVLEQAWSDEAGAYTGAFGSDRLDASVLLLPLVGFLPADDDCMRATIDAIEGQLGADGLVRRWDGDTAGFTICNYWLVECLALADEVERASEWFERTTAHANDLGLLAEEIDPGSGEQLGNFPQAFSRVGSSTRRGD
jgi:GH15 family glucan-1,4-alpha-glucosidase